MTTSTDSQRRPVFVDRRNNRFFADPLIGNGAWPQVPLAVFYGSYAADPASNPYGSQIAVGDLYFNTSANILRVWDGSLWQDAGGSNSSLFRWKKTAAGGETSLSGLDDGSTTLAYTPGSEFLYLNGALLARGADYVATTGTSITGLAALTASDVVEVFSFNALNLANLNAGAVAFTQSGTGAVQRTVEGKLRDVISVKDFGAVGDGVADDTAAIQAAIDYVESRGSLVANKSGIGGIVFIPTGTYIVSDTLKIESSGVTIAGEGWTATTIRVVDDQKDVFLFAGPDPFNTGNANPIAARPNGQGIRDLQIYLAGSDQTDSKDTTFIKVKRSLFEANNLYLQGYHVGIYLGGVAEGTRLDNIYMASAGGGAVVTQKTDSCHIHVALEPVDPADGLAQNGGDGNFYDRPVGIYLSNVQTKDPAGAIGVYDCLKVDAIDGLYVNNCHFGFGSNSQIKLHSPKQIGTLNCLFNNVFLDSSSDIGGPDSNYGLYISDLGGYNAAINKVVINGLRANSSLLAGIWLDHPNLNGFTCSGFNINQAYTPTALKGAITVNDGNGIVFSDGTIDGMQGGFYILVNGGNQVTFDNITGYSFAGLSAKEGVRLQGTPTDLSLSNVKVTDYTDAGFVTTLATGTRFSVNNCLSDDAVTVASAGTIVIKPEINNVYITGTTTILNIDSSGLNNSAWEGREVTLIFDDALTVQKTSGNMGLRSDFTTTAGSALTLVYVNGAWREKSRIA